MPDPTNSGDAPRYADPFTLVIQHLNSNPYNLTKGECLDLVRELRAKYAKAYGYSGAPEQAAARPSETAGMNMAQRILHVGGRNNAAGYVEFGGIQAVQALVRQVIRDMPGAPTDTPAGAGIPIEELILLARMAARINPFGDRANAAVRDAGASLVKLIDGEAKPS